MNLINRPYYINKITPFLGKPVIKIITGMRRSGKSKFLELLINFIKKTIRNSEILYINMESLEFDFIKDYNDLYKFVKLKIKGSKRIKYIFIDEVQLINKWEKSVNSFLAEQIADIYITGSNANIFSGELSTLLSGRYITTEIHPLTFDEFLSFRKKREIKSFEEKENEFKLYLKYGGLPAIHNFELTDEIVFDYLYNIFNTIILKDVVTRNKIRDTSNLFSITKYIFDNCGNITSGKSITDFLKSQKIKISTDTILNYLIYLQDANLIRKVERYDIKGKRYLENLAKYYLGDIGIRNGLLGYKEKDVSGILENVVYNELAKRGYKVSVGKLNGTEIDFIAEKTGGKIYIQVSYLLNSEKTIEREIKPLENIPDNYPKYLLTLDKFRKIDRNGILHMNIIDFLLLDINTGKV